MNTAISVVVEGITDEAIMRRLLALVGLEVGPVYVTASKKKLLKQLPNFNRAAKHSAWAVLADLDQDYDCVVKAKQAWLAQPAPRLCFRIAVRKAESWVLGDPEALAAFLSISRALVPHDPESLDDPKRELVNLARKSRRKGIVKDMVPREGSGRSEGAAYASRLIEFVSLYWQPEVAAGNCESLQRSLSCFQQLADKEDVG